MDVSALRDITVPFYFLFFLSQAFHPDTQTFLMLAYMVRKLNCVLCSLSMRFLPPDSGFPFLTHSKKWRPMFTF